MKHVVAIIQARMSSTRLPGKVLMDIEGKSMLWHVVNRLKKSRLIDRIVIATTTSNYDLRILRFAKENGIGYFAGSEEDVLDRYYQAAEKFKADPIVRITADCPLIDPMETDKAINYYLEHLGEFDYVGLADTYPDGFNTGVISFAALEKAWHESTLQSEREHVGHPYIIKHPDMFRIHGINYKQDFHHLVLSVDDEKDLHLVSQIFNHFYEKGKELFHIDEILEFLQSKPELLEINKDTMRNVGYLTSMKILAIGCGSIGKRHITNLKELGVKNLVICDTNEKRLAQIASEFSIEKKYTDYRQAILENVDVDAAIISTPTSLHTPIATFAAENKLNTMIEIPISHNLEGVDELLSLVKSNNLICMIGMVWRFHPGKLLIKGLIEKAAIGRIYTVGLYGGDYLPDWHPGADYREEYSARKSLGGGVIITNITGFDDVRWLFGEADEIVGVYDKISHLDIEAEDVAAYIIKLRNGILVELYTDFFQRPLKEEIHIVGEKGTISWDRQEKVVRVYEAESKAWRKFNYDFKINDMYIAEMKHFLQCLIEHKKPLINELEGWKTLQLAMAAKTSSEERKFVKL